MINKWTGFNTQGGKCLLELTAKKKLLSDEKFFKISFTIYYLAIFTALVSRITVTLTCPG
jgi:hypothetical protein